MNVKATRFVSNLWTSMLNHPTVQLNPLSRDVALHWLALPPVMDMHDRAANRGFEIPRRRPYINHEVNNLTASTSKLFTSTNAHKNLTFAKPPNASILMKSF